MSGMDDLVTWLRAQVDDDERVAREAGGDRWRADHDDLTAHILDERGWSVAYQDSLNDQQAEHVARWDPARVLAEVDTKRRILDQCVEMLRVDSSYGGSTDPDVLDPAAWNVLRLLALPYAGRDGWREEWRA